MKKRRLIELIIDPSSGQLSASRLCLMVLTLAFLPALVTLESLGVHLPLWSQFAAIVGSVAGAYGANSAARVWREGGPGKPPPPKED
jgi:hypothetical protein